MLIFLRQSLSLLIKANVDLLDVLQVHLLKPEYVFDDIGLLQDPSLNMLRIP